MKHIINKIGKKFDVWHLNKFCGGDQEAAKFCRTGTMKSFAIIPASTLAIGFKFYSDYKIKEEIINHAREHAGSNCSRITLKGYGYPYNIYTEMQVDQGFKLYDSGDVNDANKYFWAAYLTRVANAGNDHYDTTILKGLLEVIDPAGMKLHLKPAENNEAEGAQDLTGDLNEVLYHAF